MQGVLKGDRLALSRAITLIESTREDHRAEADKLLDYVVQQHGLRHHPGEAGRHRRRKELALRLGIAGPPGAGKSTFIEAMGTYLIEDMKLVRGKYGGLGHQIPSCPADW